ncbi:MAG TPA: OFA family MFS transporter [Pseudonocardia sp.]|nr:OFA family MFS transporter [Pseudonocardia sp.]
MWLPWVAMIGVSVFEYGFGAAEATLQKQHGWTLTETFWLLAIWNVFQSGIAFPAGRLREKGIVSAKTAMLTAAVTVFLAFFALGVTDNWVVNVIGYSVLGGTGAGLVYATCINMVGKWYPEKRGGKTGFVNGGFAYGALPFIFVFSYVFNAHNFAWIMGLIGLYMMVVVGVCGFLFKDPPKNWWPESVDPVKWASNPSRSLRKNPPAVRQYGTMDAIRTGQLPLMWLSLAIIGGVSLFGIGYQVPFAKSLGFGPFVAASSAGVLALVNGLGRGVVGWLSDQMGRKQALILVLLVEAVAQFGLIWSGNSHNEVLFIIFAFVAGFGGGAFYPMFAALTPDYFGENNNASNYGLIYTAKLVGGLLGLGAASSVVTHIGYTGAYTVAGIIAALSAVIALFLKQPGRGARAPQTSPSSGGSAANPLATRDRAEPA